MKVIRTEEGRYNRVTTLTIDEKVVDRINKDLEKAIVNGVKFKPLTEKDIVDLVLNGYKVSRADEEYFVELEFYQGNMKLGTFVHCEINDIFEELPADELHEEPDSWVDEFYT